MSEKELNQADIDMEMENQQNIESAEDNTINDEQVSVEAPPAEMSEKEKEAKILAAAKSAALEKASRGERNVDGATKRNRFFATCGKTLYVLVFLMALFAVSKMVYANITYTQTEIFGYSVLTLDTDDMSADGFKKKDRVITKKISSLDDLNQGDYITFYKNKNFTPVARGADRSESSVALRKIESIDLQSGTVTTKGAVGATEQIIIPFESVSGVQTKANGFVRGMMAVLLFDNSFIVLPIVLIAMLLIVFIFMFCSRFRYSKIKRQVVNGERNLLDKKCFDYNLFSKFSKKDKNIIISNAPHGMAMLYEYLLFDRVKNELSDELRELLKDKHCSVTDILCLTYGLETETTLDNLEFAKAKPKSKRNSNSSFRQISKDRVRSRSEKRNVFAVFLGTLLFAVCYLLMMRIANSFKFLSLYELSIILLIPALVELFLLLVFIEHTRIQIRLQYFILKCGECLPERYHFVVAPDAFTEDEINDYEADIRWRLLPEGGLISDDQEEEVEQAEGPLEDEPFVEEQPADEEEPIEEELAEELEEEVIEEELEEELIEEELEEELADELEEEIIEEELIEEEFEEELIEEELIEEEPAEKFEEQPIEKEPAEELEEQPIEEAPAAEETKEPTTNVAASADEEAPAKAESAATIRARERKEKYDFVDVEIGAKFNKEYPTKPRWNGTLQAKSVPTMLD